MSNAAICHISVALHIKFNYVQHFEDNKICRKYKFQGVWADLRIEFCFINPSQNILRLIYKIEQSRIFK